MFDEWIAEKKWGNCKLIISHEAHFVKVDTTPRLLYSCQQPELFVGRLLCSQVSMGNVAALRIGASIALHNLLI